MRKRDAATLTTLRAARDFLQEFANRLPRIRRSGLRRRLNHIISTLTSLDRAQSEHDVHFHRHVQTRQSLGAVLRRDCMRPIARIARADLPRTREFRVLRMPAGRPSVDTLVSRARAMLRVAKRHAGIFVSAGMPATFIEDAHATIRVFFVVCDATNLARGSRHGATVGIDAAIIEAHKVLKDLDDDIAGDPRTDAALVAH